MEKGGRDRWTKGEKERQMEARGVMKGGREGCGSRVKICESFGNTHGLVIFLSWRKLEIRGTLVETISVGSSRDKPY